MRTYLPLDLDYAKLRTQFESSYFNAEHIEFLGILRIKQGTLLFYFTKRGVFSLGVALLQQSQGKTKIWKCYEPIWRSPNPITPLSVGFSGLNLNFNFQLMEKCFSIKIPLSQIKALFGPNILTKAVQNPILAPNPEQYWECQLVLNPAVIHLNNTIHMVYRAIGNTGISVFGYAHSQDGITIDYRSTTPIFRNSDQHLPHTLFPSLSGGSCCGCEDPRLVQIDEKIYMVYTGLSSHHNPGVYLSAIYVQDFLRQKWNWSTPVRLSSEHEPHKNWVIFPELIQNKFAILHSLSPKIDIAYFDSLDFTETPNIRSHYRRIGHPNSWEKFVRGVGPSPLKTQEGWLVLYHAMDKHQTHHYKLGAMILDLENPNIISYRALLPLLEPNEPYENNGHKSGVIYCCGALIKDEMLYVYYGGADSVICAAFAPLKEVLTYIKQRKVYAIDS